MCNRYLSLHGFVPAVLVVGLFVSSHVASADAPTSGASVDTALPASTLTDDGFASIRNAILPDAAETAWEGIGWLPTLREGVLEAARQDKPLLLWVMNGHPLGCT